jgi:hypothetical protein
MCLYLSLVRPSGVACITLSTFILLVNRCCFGQLIFSYQEQVATNILFIKMQLPKEQNHHVMKEFSLNKSISHGEGVVWQSLQ